MLRASMDARREVYPKTRGTGFRVFRRRLYFAAATHATAPGVPETAVTSGPPVGTGRHRPATKRHPIKLRTRGRFNVKRWSTVLADRVRGSAFDRLLRTARHEGRREFVFGWNRGLGDVALGLVPLFARIRLEIPGSRIAVFTRADLADAFALTDVDELHVVAGLDRGTAVDPAAAAAALGIALPRSATVVADPDPTRWLDGRRREHPPALRWNADWNALADRVLPDLGCDIGIGAHVNSETARYYGYVKDWPDAAWGELFSRFPASRRVRWLLFGNATPGAFRQPNVVDLRGRTDFRELMAVIRTRCGVLVAPDSGVLTMAYYLADDFPLELVSLWSDPRQGVLKQGCSSPNPLLRHTPLVGRDDDVRNLSVTMVADAVEAGLARCTAKACTGNAAELAS